MLNPKTKKHILEVANKMNYIPNLNGKHLKSNATKVFGLFITSMQGPYYGTLTDAIYKTCEKNGYELNVFLTKNTRNALSYILGERVDGSIISNEYIDKHQEQLFDKLKVPIVFLDREKASPTISSVVFDSYKGGQAVGRYLINLGHKRMGYIHGYPSLYDDQERLRGFKDAVKNAGLEWEEDLELFGYFEEDSSFAAVKSFIKSGKTLPDAFFAANDLSAIGCIKALNSEGVLVPDEVSVIGFDDIEISQYFDPPMTTVSNPIARQGITAVERLLEILNDKEGKIDKLEGNLVVRESCTIHKNDLFKTYFRKG